MTNRGPLILLVENDPALRRLPATLAARGFRLLEAETGAKALSLFASQNPDIVLLDFALPDEDGIHLLRELRLRSPAPIIVLSARDGEADKVLALDAGADDYLTKPFGIDELLARIRVAIRRAPPIDTGGPSTLEIGPLRIDLARRLVACQNKHIRLTPIEYRLLVLLARHAGKVLTHQEILQEVWGTAYSEQIQYVRVYVGQLRRKLEADPKRPQLLRTEQGVGYRLGAQRR